LNYFDYCRIIVEDQPLFDELLHDGALFVWDSSLDFLKSAAKSESADFPEVREMGRNPASANRLPVGGVASRKRIRGIWQEWSPVR
jgi:hypothetical protein